MIDLEELDDEELEAIREDYLKLARKARTRVKRGKDDSVSIGVDEEDGKSKTAKKKSGVR
jgi:hypothetical protein